MNFALLMLILLLVTGGIWLLDRFLLAGRRQAAVRAALLRAEPALAPRPGETQADHQARKDKVLAEIHQLVGREPWWVEYPKSFFPVILIVFLLRSFLVEPFKIPSGSMIPTLLVGDFILVNKFTYGIRLPVINAKIIEVNDPRRGEVMVFRYPENPSLDYIKRVVGVPGDRLEYRNKRLTINGQLVPVDMEGDFEYLESGLSYVRAVRLWETLEARRHAIIINPDAPPVQLATVRQFPLRDRCEYNDSGFVCLVPPKHYFMMGDNRDSSSDSRYWGFVPDSNIVGKAFLVWWNFGELSRIGSRIR